MALITADDLAELPKPQIIEELSFEAILARRKDAFVLAAQAFGLDLGEFVMLESATETILLEEAAFSELLLRSRINEVYRAHLLYFATGADLDHVAESHGVTRLVGESDSDLRTRVRIFNRGSSSAGPDDWWRFHAMSADPLVEDVAVSRVHYPVPAVPEVRGTITLTILAKTPNGVPSVETLQRVRDVVTSTSVRGVTTEVIVQAATAKTFNVTANVWLYPATRQQVFTDLSAQLTTAIAANRALGFDITPSWLAAQLNKPGVQRVELTAPTGIVSVSNTEVPVLGTVALTLVGRAF